MDKDNKMSLLSGNKKLTIFIIVLVLLATLNACTLSREDTLVIPAERSFNSLNSASSGVVFASSSLDNYSPDFAVDGNPETYWDPGAVAPQWIEIDLGVSINVGNIQMAIKQEAPGETEINIYGKGSRDKDEYQLLHQFNGQTSDGQILVILFTEIWQGIKYIKVETSKSTTSIGWSEIEVFPPNQDPYNLPYVDSDGDGVIDLQDWCPNTPGSIENNGC